MTRIDRRRHPVREQHERVERKAQAFPIEHRSKGCGRLVHVMAIPAKALVNVGAGERHESTIRRAREQHARLLEELPRRGDVIRTRLRRRKRSELAIGVIEAVAPRCVGGVISGIDATARKHVCAAHERVTFAAADQKDFRSARRIAQHDHGRGGAGIGGDRRRHNREYYCDVDET